MRQAKPLLLFTTILMLLVSNTGFGETHLPEPFRLSADELTDLTPRLRQGGYVIYFRHMSTDHSREDQRPVDLKDCSTQRPLSKKGRQQAIALGKAIRKLKLPVGKVISSAFCRCRDTASLAFKHFVTSDDLYFAMGLTRQDKRRKGQNLRELFATLPAAGKNTIIVSHSANLQEAVGLWPKPEGVAYIFKPTGNGQFKVIGKVNPSTWVQVSQ